jgi:VWFA-related protein
MIFRRLHLRQRFALLPKLKTNSHLSFGNCFIFFMVNYQIRNAFKFLILLFLLLFFAVDGFGQSRCVSDDEVKKIVSGINAQENAAFNRNLQQQLLKIKQDTTGIYQEMSRLPTESQSLEERLKQQKENNVATLCQILRQYGWTSKALVGAEASDVASAVFLDSASLEFQKQLIPVIEAAFKAGEISKSSYAKMADQLRVRSNQKQMFGTVIGVSKDLLVLYPIENEATVDNLRRQYELPPLAEQIRRFEQRHQAVVIKPPSIPISVQPKQEIKPGLKTPDNSDNEKEEVIKVETNLVNLNVTVMPEKPGTIIPPLNKDDFSVFENNREQAIEFFATSQVPFDITLLIDISGSTANKIKLIRKTTRSFIKAARPSDRISIVVFDQEVTVISSLTENRELLLASVDKIKSGGGSKVWDALALTLDKSAELQNANPQNRERRSGIVFITDGADNSFVNDVDASSVTFADLLEKVRRNSALIVPIHLDTREDYGMSEKLYYGTRRALNLLADESGGLFYEARKYEDLENVYEQVINDLSRVYSIGYSPSNNDSKTVWRAVKLNLKNHPNLTVRSRMGYYAR